MVKDLQRRGHGNLWRAFAGAVRSGSDPRNQELAVLLAFPAALEEGVLTAEWAASAPGRRRTLVDRYAQRFAPPPGRHLPRAAAAPAAHPPSSPSGPAAPREDGGAGEPAPTDERMVDLTAGGARADDDLSDGGRDPAPPTAGRGRDAPAAPGPALAGDARPRVIARDVDTSSEGWGAVRFMGDRFSGRESGWALRPEAADAPWRAPGSAAPSEAPRDGTPEPPPWRQPTLDGPPPRPASPPPHDDGPPPERPLTPVSTHSRPASLPPSGGGPPRSPRDPLRPPPSPRDPPHPPSHPSASEDVAAYAPPPSRFTNAPWAPSLPRTPSRPPGARPRPPAPGNVVETAWSAWQDVVNAPAPATRAASRPPPHPAGPGATRPRTPGRGQDDEPPAHRPRAARDGGPLPPEAPDNNAPARAAYIRRIKALSESDRLAWKEHARRHIPIGGQGTKLDPSLHSDDTLASFLETLSLH